MKSVLIFSLLFILSNKINAQDKIYYNSPMMEIVILQNNEIGLKKPFGRNIEIEFDKFFKTYYLTYYDENGTYSYFKLSFLKDVGSVGKEDVWIMYDEGNNKYVVANQIETKGRLVLGVENTLQGDKPSYFWINDIQQK